MTHRVWCRAQGELVLDEKVVLQQEPRHEIHPRLLKAKTTLLDCVKIQDTECDHSQVYQD